MKSIVIWDGPSSVVCSVIGVIFLIGFGMKVMEMLTPMFLTVLGIAAVVLIIGAVISGIIAVHKRTCGDFLGRYVGWCGVGVVMLAISLEDLFGTVKRPRGIWPISWTETITTQTGHFAKNLMVFGWLLLLLAAILGIVSWLSKAGRTQSSQHPVKARIIVRVFFEHAGLR